MEFCLKRIIHITALCAVILLFIACKEKEIERNNSKIKVAVSGYLPYTLAKSIFADTAEIQMLMPPAAGVHSFEPSPKNALQIKNADFFFYISDRIEPWAKSLSDGVGTIGIALAYNLPDINPKDPHYWMSFQNAAAMAGNMAFITSEKFPQLKPVILGNADRFENEMQLLDKLYKQLLSNCKTRDIYHIGHNAFGYIARKYNLNFQPLNGSLSESEPAAAQMANMIKEIKDKKTDYIFSEKIINPKLASVIAAESGAKILNLYAVEDITKEEFEKETSYTQFMMMNLENLVKGLACN
ncbi:MAG: zinc ABC transporter substrate-binding protein [Elusimicrobiota bacterium]|nr:zinc ABC transporter substrate-binding protein [Elusimicrobiota bacterium]